MSDLKELHHVAVMARGGYRFAKCDEGCGRLGTDLHHIISRGRTHSPEAREASEVLVLTAWLCRDCHIGSGNVHNPVATNRLLLHNCEMFGEDEVLEALENVNQYLTYPILITPVEK